MQRQGATATCIPNHLFMAWRAAEDEDAARAAVPVEEARRKPYTPEHREGARGSQKKGIKNRLRPAAAPCLLAVDNPGRAPPPHARGRHAHPIFRIRNIKTFCRAVHGPPKPWFVAILFRGTRWGISPTAFCRAEPSRCRRKTAVFICKRTADSPQYEQGYRL